MVDHIRATGRVGAVVTPTRSRKVKRDPNRRDQRQREPEEEKDSTASEGRHTPPDDAQGGAQEAPKPADHRSAYRGQRINVII